MRVVARTPRATLALPTAARGMDENGVGAHPFHVLRKTHSPSSLGCCSSSAPMHPWLAPLTIPTGELNRTDTYTCTHTLKSARAILHACTRSLVHVYREATKFVHFADAAFLSTATKRGDALFSLGHYVHASPQNAVLESFCEGYFDSELWTPHSRRVYTRFLMKEEPTTRVYYVFPRVSRSTRPWNAD